MACLYATGPPTGTGGGEKAELKGRSASTPLVRNGQVLSAWLGKCVCRLATGPFLLHLAPPFLSQQGRLKKLDSMLVGSPDL